ncbi:hypothetical protein FRC06_000357 [Ceratobasidium sp. 370]|nr:hypothetical protein FRC06_000357 [Ceratobasidium sp. 370]
MTTAAEERRPLLERAPDDVESVQGRKDDVGATRTRVTPLPMKQISILLLMQLAEPVASTVIYPFIAELVNETGVTGGDPSKIGYYAGLIESIFFLTEGLFVLQYGRTSDRIGRRPVLLFGMFGLSISIFSFGLSKTFVGLVLTRALSGALNGNIGVSKSMLGELTDETNQAQCFAFLPIVWSAGSTIGPFLGGTLSHPAALLPSVFDTPFWREYPYFLPCLVTAIFTAGVLIYSAFSLEETLHTHTEPKQGSSESVAEYGAIDDIMRPVSPPAPSIRSVLTRRTCIAIVNYAFLAFTDIAYLCIIPVMLAASVQGGGLGLTPRSIGLILGLQGIVTGLIPVFCFAPIHRRFGSKRTYVVGLASYACLVLSLPLMNELARRGMMGAMWTVMGAHLILSCPAFMAFSCMIIFVTSAAPSKSSLGTLNGISQTTISVIRAIGPATATSLFALSVERNLLGGWFVYAVLIGVNLVGLIASWWLKDEKRAY